jgi:hypothetical protein
MSENFISSSAWQNDFDVVFMFLKDIIVNVYIEVASKLHTLRDY